MALHRVSFEYLVLSEGKGHSTSITSNLHIYRAELRKACGDGMFELLIGCRLQETDQIVSRLKLEDKGPYFATKTQASGLK